MLTFILEWVFIGAAAAVIFGFVARQMDKEQAEREQDEELS